MHNVTTFSRPFPKLPAVSPLPAGAAPAMISAVLDQIDVAFGRSERHAASLRSRAESAADALDSERADPSAAADQWHAQHIQPLQDEGWTGAWSEAFSELCGCVRTLGLHLHEWTALVARVDATEARHRALGDALSDIANIIEECGLARCAPPTSAS